jgi:hypothetical protein
MIQLCPSFLSDLRINFIITDGVFLIKRGKIFIIFSNYFILIGEDFNIST